MPAPNYISAEELQLLTFFEVEPNKLDANEHWPYNVFTYRRTLGDLQITFTVAPAYKDFSFIVERDGATHIELSAQSIFDIRYHEDRGLEWLEILITERERVELRLRPSFSLKGRVGPPA